MSSHRSIVALATVVALKEVLLSSHRSIVALATVVVVVIGYMLYLLFFAVKNQTSNATAWSSLIVYANATAWAPQHSLIVYANATTWSSPTLSDALNAPANTTAA